MGKRLAVLILAAAGLLSCSQQRPTASGLPAWSFSTTPAVLSGAPGATLTTTITVDRSQGLDGPVDVSLDTPPLGITSSGLSIPAGADSGTFKIEVAPTMALGAHDLTVVASSGGEVQMGTLRVVVSLAPDLNVRINASEVTVAPGSTGAVGITLTRSGGLSGLVDLSLAGAPVGVSGSFSSDPAAGNSSTLALQVSAGVVVGTHNLTVRAAVGSVARTATFSLKVTAAPDFSLALTPAEQTVEQGQQSTVTVSLSRVNGHSGIVNLTTDRLPDGVSASFGDASLDGASTPLTVSVGAGAAPGSYDLTLRGTSGSLVKTATLALTITAKPVPDLSVSIEPTKSVQRGESAEFAVTLARANGQTGQVTLSVEGLPAGLSGSFDPAMPTGSTSTLRVTTTAAAPLGTHAFTVRARAGPLDKTATASITVAAPAAGSLDQSFGTDGVVKVDFGASEAGRSVALMADGRIVVGIDGTGSALNNLVVARLRPDGALDQTFGNGGVAVVDLEADVQLAGLGVQSDGRVVIAVAPAQRHGLPNVTVVRLTASGALDLSFGNAGISMTDVPDVETEEAQALLVQEDDKILVSVYTLTSTPSVALVRLTSSGTPDPTFSEDGIVPYVQSRSSAMRLQPDGKILVVGTSGVRPSDSNRGYIARVNPDGSFDATFGTGGYVEVDVGGDESVSQVLVQPDGRILIGLSVTYYGDHSNVTSAYLLQRYEPTGARDLSFGTSGSVQGSWQVGSFASADATGFTMFGSSSPRGNVVLEKRTPAGFLDASFGSAGRVTIDLGGFDHAQDVAVQADGKLVLVGLTASAEGAPSDAAIFRVMP